MSAPALTIQGIEATPVLVPMRRALGTSVMQVRQAPLLLIDVRTHQGVTGRAYLFCYLDAAAPAAAGLARDCGKFLAGRSAAPADVRSALETRFKLIGLRGITAMVAAGVDMACWDALGVAAGLPLARLVGGELKPVAAYNSNGLGLVAPQAAAAEALELVGEGFRAIKMRLGRPEAADDLAAVRAVRAAIPIDVALMADYNRALTAAEALERCRALDGEGLYWIEEPLRHDDYAGSAQLAAAIATPVQIGENFAGPRVMAHSLALHASDYVMPDVERIGGVSGWMEAAALARSAGIEMSTHLFPEVSVHLMTATPTAHWLEFVDWAAPILREPLTVSNGFVTPPDRPGNGMAWDEDAVKRYRID